MLQNSSELDDSLSELKSSLSISRIKGQNGTKKFVRVNYSLTFLKNIGEINENMEAIFCEAKEEVMKLIQEKINIIK